MKSAILLIALASACLVGCGTAVQNNSELKLMATGVVIESQPIDLYSQDTGIAKRFYLSYSNRDAIITDRQKEFAANLTKPGSQDHKRFLVYCDNNVILYSKGGPISKHVSISKTEIIKGDASKESQAKTWFVGPEQVEYCSDCLDLRQIDGTAVGLVTTEAEHIHKWVPLTLNNWPTWWNLLDNKLNLSSLLN